MISSETRKLLTKSVKRWMNFTFYSKAFQNATCLYLTTFSQLARVFDLRSCSISYMRRLLTSFPGAACWSDKLKHTVEDKGPIHLELFQSRKLYHTKQTILILQIPWSGVFSLEPVWTIFCINESASLLTVLMTPWWLYLGDSNLLKTVIVVWGIVSPLNLNS